MTADEAVRDHKGLVWAEARRAFHHGIGRKLGSLEDCAQVGFLGLLNAVKLFKPDMGIKFNTYATMAVRRTITNAAQDAGLVRVPRHIQARMHKHPDRNCSMQNAATKAASTNLIGQEKLELSPDREHWDGSANEASRIEIVIRDHLPPRFQRLIRARFCQGKKLHEISAEEGVTTQAVQQAVQRGLRMLRHHLSARRGG